MNTRVSSGLLRFLFTCVPALILHCAPALAQSAGDCPSYAPVARVTGAKIYKESGANDAAGAKANKELLSTVDDFLNYEASALDKPGAKADLACPYQALRNWAAADALLEPPETPGRVARVWIASGVGFLLLKYELRGHELTPDVRRWYSALAGMVRRDYHDPLKKGGYNGLYSNVYPWTATSSAIAALVDGDSEALRFQDEAWNNMIAEIRPDGSLAGEMSRGDRALIYHQLAANGLLALRGVRRALGRRDEPAQVAALKRLLSFVGETLCHPDSIADAAGAKQEMPGVWGFRVGLAFGGDLLPPTWKKCGPTEMNWSAPEYAGGDTRVAVQALEAARQR